MFKKFLLVLLILLTAILGGCFGKKEREEFINDSCPTLRLRALD